MRCLTEKGKKKPTKYVQTSPTKALVIITTHNASNSFWSFLVGHQQDSEKKNNNRLRQKGKLHHQTDGWNLISSLCLSASKNLECISRPHKKINAGRLVNSKWMREDYYPFNKNQPHHEPFTQITRITVYHHIFFFIKCTSQRGGTKNTEWPRLTPHRKKKTDFFLFWNGHPDS